MSSTTRVRAVVCRVGQEPEVVEVEPTLDGIKDAINLTYFDTIDAVALGPEVHAYIDDDGAIRANPQPNRCGLCGDFIVMGAGRKGEERSLTQEEIRKVLIWAEKGKGTQHPGLPSKEPAFTYQEFDSFEQMQNFLEVRRQARDRAWESL